MIPRQLAARRVIHHWYYCGVKFSDLIKNTTGYPIWGVTFFFEDRNMAATTVELERRASSAPHIIQVLYRNKYSFWARTFVRNYLYAFSPQYLWLDQEGNGIYSIWFRGQFYLIELPLMILGFLYLFIKKRSIWNTITLLTLFTPLASALGPGNPSFTMRSILLLPLLIVYIGTGFVALTDRGIVPKKWYVFVIGIICISYVAHVAGYVSQYYFDWARYGAKYYSYDTYLMTQKVTTEIAAGNNVIVAPANDNTFLHWMIYQHRDPLTIQQSLVSGKRVDGNLTMESLCPTNTIRYGKLLLPPKTVYITNSTCVKNISPSEVLYNLDNQSAWVVLK